VVADVSGKGVSSALLASLLQGAFLLGSELQLPLDALVGKVNRFLLDRAQREKYATLFYCTIARSGALAWVNAGHCAPFLVRTDGEIRSLRTTGTPLGLFRDASFEMERLQLAGGDKIIAYSDGLPDAENAASESFESKLSASLSEFAMLNAQEAHDRLIDDILKFKEGEPLRDDVTLLVLEYRGDQPEGAGAH
jgi:sigma-B regulation protein RsbU (phosphoserine phosphatase)